MQTRLPGELAQELESIAADFEMDLLSYQQQVYSSDDSEQEEVEPLRPLRNFPAIGLISAMHSAIEVGTPLTLLSPWACPCCPQLHVGTLCPACLTVT